jgi:hypothetical protein
MGYHLVLASLKKIRSMTSLRIYLGLIEKLILRKHFRSKQPQVFILGLPRSGTTLTYQYVVHRLNLSYFTNGVGKYYLSPCLITYCQSKLFGDYYSDFKSNYGKVSGAAAPREAGSFWNRFFGSDDYILYKELKQKDVCILKNTIACIQNIYDDLPFVNKNVKHMLRIEALSKIFPNSYFLIVKRSLEHVAISMVRGRYSNLADPNQWWSVKPPNYEKICDLPIYEQIGLQIVSLQEKLDSDLENLPEQRILYVSYEEFCNHPEGLIDKLAQVMHEISFKNSAKDRFEISLNTPQNSEERSLVDLIRHASSKSLL